MSAYGRNKTAIETRHNARRISRAVKIARVSPWRACISLIVFWAGFTYYKGYIRDFEQSGEACYPEYWGAVADGNTLDTVAIQKAIYNCKGAAVVLGNGTYVSGTLFFQDYTVLEIRSGATLRASHNMADYHRKHKNLIFANRCRNITIRGPGTIDGQGYAFFDAKLNPLARPSPLLELVNCQHVSVTALSIVDSPGWTLRPKNCDDVQINNVQIRNDRRLINTDGIDPDSSVGVRISNTYIESGDDCIVLKTTDRGAPARSLSDVIVENCTLISSASALKIGTESHANFTNITFRDCTIRGSRTGIAILPKDGGIISNVSMERISMQTLPKWGKGVEWPIVIDVEKRSKKSRISKIKDVKLRNITIVTKGRIAVAGPIGVEDSIDNIEFENISVHISGFESLEDVQKLRGSDQVGELGSGDFDYGPIPSLFIFANAKNVALKSVRITWPDALPSVVNSSRYLAFMKDVQGALVPNISSGYGGFPAYIFNETTYLWMSTTDGHQWHRLPDETAPNVTSGELIDSDILVK